MEAIYGLGYCLAWCYYWYGCHSKEYFWIYDIVIGLYIYYELTRQVLEDSRRPALPLSTLADPSLPKMYSFCHLDPHEEPVEFTKLFGTLMVRLKDT